MDYEYIHCYDPEFNDQLKLIIRPKFIKQVGPFKVVDHLKKILTDDDIEHIKTCTRNYGNFVGAEELFNRLTRHPFWFHDLADALQQALPEVAAYFVYDYGQLNKQLSMSRSHEVHLKDGKGCISLLHAATRGHVGCIRDLLTGEVDLNSKNERGETALYLAAARGHDECLEILIQAGCRADLRNENQDSPLYAAAKNMNKQAFTSIWAAAARGHVECLKLLLAAGATANSDAVDRPDGFTPLMAAALAGEEKCVQALIDAGATVEDVDMYGRTPLFIAAMEGRVNCLQMLMEAGADINTPPYQGETPLYAAAGYRNFECVTLLLSAGADIHRTTKSGETALMMASRSGDEESLQALIDAGSNLNAQDNDGKTALIMATISAFDICVQILVENGANIHIRDKSGSLAIHYAARNYTLQLTILVELGVDINAADNNGDTPLMEAVKRRNYKALQYLIMKGADVQKVNNKGQTALKIAETDKENWMCANLLRRNKKTELSYEEAEKVTERGTIDEDATNEGSTEKEGDTALRSDMGHVDTLSRSHDVEYCTEPEGYLQQSYTGCQKNPGHIGFIPITEFGLSHLSDKYRDQRIVDVIKAEAELTVRLLVKYTSPARPDGYNASNMRGKKGRRVGSGWITNALRKYSLQDNRQCPCPDCEKSGDPRMSWGQLLIKAAMHVVFDSSEAKETILHIFADVDRPDGMHKLRGYDVDTCNQDDDRCSILAVTHDLQLYSYIESMIEQRKKTWRRCWYLQNDFLAVVSHPHGCSKHVTMGEWTDRYPARNSKSPSRYIYNVPTCPGSSGAPVILFRNDSETVHPHSGSRKDGSNISATSEMVYPFFMVSPGISRYNKEHKRKNGTGNFLPKGWDSLFEPERLEPHAHVQLQYDFQQRPPPQAGN